MNEEGDTPTVAEAVQSTPMVSLNDEIAWKTDKKSVFQRIGSLFGRKKSKAIVETELVKHVVAQLTKKLEDCRKERDRFKDAHLTSEAENKDLIAKLEMESAKIENLEVNVKLKTKEIESLKRESNTLNEKLQASRDEIDRYKSEWNSNASRMTEVDDELKSKSSEIENLKKEEVEWKSRISQLEDAVKSMKIEKNLKSRDATIHAKFTEVSRFKIYERVFSQPTEIDGITWKTSVYKGFGDYFYFYLEAEKENAVEWSCPVIAEFRLISQKSEELSHKRRVNERFDANNREADLKWFSHKKLFDEEVGYVKNDTIIVEVDITTFPIN